MEKQQELFLYTIKLYNDTNFLWVYKDSHYISKRITLRKNLEKIFNTTFTDKDIKEAKDNIFDIGYDFTDKRPYLSIEDKKINLWVKPKISIDKLLESILICLDNGFFKLKPDEKKRFKILKEKEWGGRQSVTIYTNKHNVSVLNTEYKRITKNEKIKDFSWEELLHSMDFIDYMGSHYAYSFFIAGVSEVYPMDHKPYQNSSYFRIRIDRFSHWYYNGDQPTDKETLEMLNRGREILKNTLTNK